MPKLTHKQEKACQAYIELGDKSAAYRASYNCSNMKPESVNRKACELFKRDKIRSRVDELQKEISWRNKLTIDSIIHELKKIILFNPKDLFDAEGELKNMVELPDEIATAISSIDVNLIDSGGIIKRSSKIRFYNKLDALEKLAKHLGFYEKDHRQRDQEKTVIIIPDNGRD